MVVPSPLHQQMNTFHIRPRPAVSHAQGETSFFFYSAHETKSCVY